MRPWTACINGPGALERAGVLCIRRMMSLDRPLTASVIASRTTATPKSAW